MNKVLLPKYKKRINVTGPYMYNIEVFSKYHKVNLPTIFIEHFNIIMTTKDGRQGLAYGFWINRGSAYFNVECCKGKAG